MNTQTTGKIQLEQALNFVNWMKIDALLTIVYKNDVKNALTPSQLRQNEKQIEFFNLKSQQVLISKIHPQTRGQDDHEPKKSRKLMKKQTTLKKKQRKLEKPESKITSKQVTTVPITSSQNISLKMLLNDQIPKKNYESSALWQTMRNKSNKSSSSLRSENNWMSPNGSTGKLKVNQQSPNSPINQFNREEEIQIVRHRNFQAFGKNQDVIERMEELKASRKSQKSESKKYETVKFAVTQQQNKRNFKQSKREGPSLDGLIFLSVGNKYMTKIVENYADTNRPFIK